MHVVPECYVAKITRQSYNLQYAAAALNPSHPRLPAMRAKKIATLLSPSDTRLEETLHTQRLPSFEKYNYAILDVLIASEQINIQHNPRCSTHYLYLKLSLHGRDKHSSTLLQLPIHGK